MFGRDGGIDLVAGNIGLNTKSKATEKKPELLYYVDFDGTGKPRILESKFECSVCFPHRGYSCSSNAMPRLRSKLPTFHSFAIKSLEAIYSQSRLEKARRFEANTLESGIFINDGSGRFYFVQLPHLAQAFRVFSIAIKDFTNDDKPDLCLVGNSNSLQRETGNMDGGISLRGDAVVPTSDNHPAGEHAGLAIDNNAATKYLNFDGANNTASGLTITTGGGVVVGLWLTAANDATDRDPTSLVLSGSKRACRHWLVG